LANLPDKGIDVVGAAVIDQQLGKWITPASEQLQRRAGQPISQKPMRPGLDIGLHVVASVYRLPIRLAVKEATIGQRH
jgi:hypothetical protein